MEGGNRKSDVRSSQDPCRTKSDVGTDDRTNAAVRATGDATEVERVARDSPLLAVAEGEGEGRRRVAGVGVVAGSVDARVGNGGPEESGGGGRSLWKEGEGQEMSRKERMKEETYDDDRRSSIDNRVEGTDGGDGSRTDVGSRRQEPVALTRDAVPLRRSSGVVGGVHTSEEELRARRSEEEGELAGRDLVFGDESREKGVAAESRDGRVSHAEETVVGIVLEVGGERVGGSEGLLSGGETGD